MKCRSILTMKSSDDCASRGRRTAVSTLGAARLLGFILSAASLSFSQSAPVPKSAGGEDAKPEAGELLKKVGEAYKAVSTLRGDATLAVETNRPDAPENMEMPVSLSITAQGKMRIESKGVVPMVTVADGQTLWVYLPLFNRYVKMPLGQSGAYAGPGFTVPSDYLQQFSKVGENVKSASVEGAETVRVNDSDVSCWIVAANYESPTPPAAASVSRRTRATAPSGKTRLWVDKTRYLIYRESSEVTVAAPGASAPGRIKNTLTFTRLTVNEPIPDAAFVFQPPEGATEMDPSSFMPSAPAPN